jgi:hypothetical protein
MHLALFLILICCVILNEVKDPYTPQIPRAA